MSKKVKEPKLSPAPVPVEEPKEEPKIESEARLEPPAEPVLAAEPVDPDYLRQYQYKNVNGQPLLGSKLSDPDVGSKSAGMKKFLLSQPKVSIFVPKAETEDPKVQLSVNLNGYRLDFPKNVYLEVPQQIAEVIRESLNQQASALLPFQINRDQANRNALS